MKKLLLAVCLLIFNGCAMALNNWTAMSCAGSDGAGQYVTLFVSYGSRYVIINGDNLLIVGKTKDGLGVVTQNFKANTGILVYDSIVPTSNITLNIYQFNAVTKALLAQASLSCRITGNNPSMNKVIEQSIFESIKK